MNLYKTLSAVRVMLITGAIFTAAVILFVFDPGKTHFYPSCPFYFLTGFYCAGCGSLRALHQLLHGHVLKAFALNPLMVIALPFICYNFISRFKISGKSLPSVTMPYYYGWIIFWIIILYSIFRNIPYYPFSCLAP